jgi:hypothetical protein
MTRKDFELIAGTIAALDITLGEAGRKTVAELFGFSWRGLIPASIASAS